MVQRAAFPGGPKPCHTFRRTSVADRLSSMSFDPEEAEENQEQFENTEFAADEVFADEASGEDETDEVAAEKASGAARKLESIVLAHVLAPKYQPVKPRVIAKQLKLPSEQQKALKLAIRRLVKRGKLSYGSGHQVRPPQSQESGGRSQVSGKRRQEPGDIRQPTPDARFPSPLGRDKHGKNIVIGTFRRTASGFGFVRPQGAKRGDKS